MGYLSLGKRLIKLLLGKDLLFRPDVKMQCERLGSNYGGWHVAIAALDETSVVYSVGVGEDVSFDLELIRRSGVTVHAFDPTPRSIAWVRRQSFPRQFVLHEYGLANFNGMAQFYGPENPSNVSHTLVEGSDHSEEPISVPVKTLEAIRVELGHDRIDLLKLDIEGAEYGVIRDLRSAAVRPGQLLVEFHHRFPSIGIAKTKQAVGDLRDIGYKLFSVSESGDEYGFIL